MSQFNFKITGFYAGLGRVSHGTMQVYAENLVMARLKAMRAAHKEAAEAGLISKGHVELAQA